MIFILPSSSRRAAGDEFNAALVAYKRRELMETLSSTSKGEQGDGTDKDKAADNAPRNQNVGVVDSTIPGLSTGGDGKVLPFRAAGALIFPGLDRGRTLWEDDNYQSSLVSKTVPVPLGGFFVNGVAGGENGKSTSDACCNVGDWLCSAGLQRTKYRVGKMSFVMALPSTHVLRRVVFKWTGLFHCWGVGADTAVVSKRYLLSSTVRLGTKDFSRSNGPGLANIPCSFV